MNGNLHEFLLRMKGLGRRQRMDREMAEELSFHEEMLRSKLLREPWPASTGLVCKALLRPEMLIEVDPFAILD